MHSLSKHRPRDAGHIRIQFMGHKLAPFAALKQIRRDPLTCRAIAERLLPKLPVDKK